MNKEPVIEQLSKTGADLMKAAEPGPEKDILKMKLAHVETRYADVKGKCTDRKNQLDKLAPLVEQYSEALQALLLFLDASEEKLQILKEISIDEENATWQKPLIKAS